MYIVVAKDKTVGKVGDGATTFQCIAGPATFTWLGFKQAAPFRTGVPAPATENLGVANDR